MSEDTRPVTVMELMRALAAQKPEPPPRAVTILPRTIYPDQEERRRLADAGGTMQSEYDPFARGWG
jgi:hypothetical protein